ncbi:hypothetical protein CKAH01_13581 [Colletotrichum kahawae]|uniref:Uncharacterized protein n=1 Tax=Colletotrichum kahawae TaxID=34407 RepID=A0AAD9YRZ3_COLKA|nr:hypothetical protein CKAH01_13581 [Colletotrichum kahawae]
MGAWVVFLSQGPRARTSSPLSTPELASPSPAEESSTM